MSGEVLPRLEVRQLEERVSRLIAEREEWERRFMEQKEAFAAEHDEVERLREAAKVDRRILGKVGQEADALRAEVERLREENTTLRRLNYGDPVELKAELEREREVIRRLGSDLYAAQAEVERLRAELVSIKRSLGEK